MQSYAVSLLKSYWGDAATPENDFCFDYLPRITGDHSTYTTVKAMIEGRCKGYFLVGENPAVGSANGKMQRLGMANLDWLVVRDLQMIESATFWKDGPEIETGELVTEEIGTEIFFLPAASHVEKAGSFTQTQRMLQWRDKAVDPPGDCRSELRLLLRARPADPRKARGLHATRWTGRCSTWPGTTRTTRTGRPTATRCCARSTAPAPTASALSAYTELKADGSTACGCWIYCGVYADEVNQARRRKPHWEQD